MNESKQGHHFSSHVHRPFMIWYSWLRRPEVLGALLRTSSRRVGVMQMKPINVIASDRMPGTETDDQPLNGSSHGRDQFGNRTMSTSSPSPTHIHTGARARPKLRHFRSCSLRGLQHEVGDAGLVRERI